MLFLHDDDRVLGKWRSRCTSSGCCNSSQYCFEDDPLAPPRPPPPVIDYPSRVLARLVLALPCDPEPDQQTVYVDGKNLWIRSVTRVVGDGATLLIADRSRRTADDLHWLHEGLGISHAVDVGDDSKLGAALDALPAADLARRAPSLCAKRRRAVPAPSVPRAP
jgi:hypothetical protein